MGHLQGKVSMEPTVLVQTLHGHSGTITGLFVYSSHILSSSTDGTVRVWRAVEGRAQLLYPWYNLQVGAAGRVGKAGDLGWYGLDAAAAFLAKLKPRTKGMTLVAPPWWHGMPPACTALACLPHAPPWLAAARHTHARMHAHTSRRQRW